MENLVGFIGHRFELQLSTRLDHREYSRNHQSPLCYLLLFSSISHPYFSPDNIHYIGFNPSFFDGDDTSVLRVERWGFQGCCIHGVRCRVSVGTTVSVFGTKI
ncbi:hypothetical protein Hanom_Chr09g00828591 [Helianthus anomalus]